MYYHKEYQPAENLSAGKKIVHRRTITMKTGQGYSGSGVPVNQVSPHDIERETEAAKIWCRRNLREWPHNHELLAHVIGDEIVFWFEEVITIDLAKDVVWF